MREFIKVTFALLTAASLGTALFAWFVPDRAPVAPIWWTLRLGMPVLAVVAMAGFLRLHFQRDRAPDFLSQVAGAFFDRAGFCFAPVAAVENGVCVMQIFFQNRYARPCQA